MKLSEAFELWLKKKRRELTPVYMKTLRRWTQNWTAVFGNDKEVSEVTVADVEKLETLRNDGRRSASALNQERVYLRGFFSWARALGFTAADPAVNWKYRRPVVRREYATITREEEDRLVAAAERMPWLQKYVRLAVCTGLREGTIRQLTWAMVREDGVLEIPARLMKARQAHRIVLPTRALAALGPRGEGLLIRDLPTKDNVYRAFKRAGKAAGISEVASPHDLRRTWVERLSRAGQPLQVIQSLGAWKTVSVLLNHYVQPVSTDLQRKILEAV